MQSFQTMENGFTHVQSATLPKPLVVAGETVLVRSREINGVLYVEEAPHLTDAVTNTEVAGPVENHAQTQMASIEVDRLCRPVSSGVECGTNILYAAPAVIDHKPANELPGSAAGKPAVVLSEQFTAVLVKPESLLCGIEVPVIKTEVEGNLVSGIPSNVGGNEGGASSSWALSVQQQHQLREQQQWHQLQQLQHPQQATHELVNVQPQLHLQQQPTSIIIPQETSPDSASATPTAPYMFEPKDRSFSCEFCPNIRFTRSQLRRHKSVHFGQRNYECSDCGKRFAWKHSMESHKMLHMGQCPFTCKNCGKGFSAAHHLQNHEKIHGPERIQYHCSQCNMIFSRPDELVVHSRLHSGHETFSCSECGKSFTTKFGLNTHMRAHGLGNSRKFACQVCLMKFTEHSALVEHAKVHSKPAESFVFLKAEGREVEHVKS